MSFNSDLIKELAQPVLCSLLFLMSSVTSTFSVSVWEFKHSSGTPIPTINLFCGIFIGGRWEDLLPPTEKTHLILNEKCLVPHVIHSKKVKQRNDNPQSLVNLCQCQNYTYCPHFQITNGFQQW